MHQQLYSIVLILLLVLSCSDPNEVITPDEISPSRIITIEYSPNTFTLIWEQNTASLFSEYKLYKANNVNMSQSELIWNSEEQTDTTITLLYDSGCNMSFFQIFTISIDGIDAADAPVEVLSSSFCFSSTIDDIEWFQRATHVVQLHDFSYTILGDLISGRGADWDAVYMVHLDQVGQFQSSKIVASWMWANPTSISALDNGDFILTSNEGADMGFGQGAVLQRTDALGNSLWSIEFRETMYESKYLYDHIISGNSIVSVGDYTADEGNYIVDMWVISHDLEGNELWNSIFVSPDSMHYYEKGISISETSAGNFLVVSAAYEGWPDKKSDLVLFKIDNNGNQLWSQVIQTNLLPHETQQTSDENYIIVGQQYSSSMDIFLMKISEEGEILWFRSFGDIREDYGPAITYSDDQGILLMYNTGLGANIARSFTIVKLTADGEMEWTRVYNNGEVNDLINTNDGGYVIVGSENSFPKIFKVDCGGNFYE